MKVVILFTFLTVGALAQQAAWAQCGGINYNGGTSCISGYSCKYVNDWYSQCQPGTVATTLQTTTKSTTSTTPPTQTPTGPSQVGNGKFKWLGVDESGAEFGAQALPGQLGRDYIFASTSSIDTLMSQGYNIFRLPFLMERMVPNQMTGPVDAAYLNNYAAVVNHITQKGGYAVIDPHNFGRYYGSVITDTSGFQAFWNTVASNFKSNSNAIFDTNNEYHDMDQTLVLNLNQAAINGIRASGAGSQYIFVEGNDYSGAHSWSTSNNNLKTLSDPKNKLVYEMHQYLDSDNSGTSPNCVSSTIGAERIAGATAWLRSNNKLGVMGEFAGGANSQCRSAVTGMLDAMQAASDVWLGGLFWGGGPWWGNYIFAFEPPSSIGYDYYNTALQKYRP